MFKQRLISGIFLVIIAALALYFGGFVTLSVTAVISLAGVFELLRIIKQESSPLAVVIYTATVVYYLLLILDMDQYTLPLVLFSLIALLTIYVFSFPRYEISDVAIAFFSFFYVTVMLACIYRIRALSDGGAMIVLVFLSAWGNDTLAYCAGRLFGKHKMSPVLSPKKTVEGAIGGVAGAGLLGVIYGFIAGMFIQASFSLPLVFGIVCALGGMISIVGDLAASAIKRNYEVKDYSNLIPGHGGILDRFDSIIITAPIIYYLLVLAAGLS